MEEILEVSDPVFNEWSVCKETHWRRKKRWIMQERGGKSRGKGNWNRNKEWLDRLHSRLDTAKERIEKLEDKPIKCPKVKAEGLKRMKYNSYK